MAKHVAAVLSLSLVCALHAAPDDAAKMSSGMMNPESPLRVVEHSDGGSFKILFYGNSISMHLPMPKIGWTNNWGMAASAEEKDFVHLVVRGLEERRGEKADWRIRKLYALERNISTNVETVAEISSDVAWEPDYVVIAIGENVPKVDESNAADYRRLLAGIARPFAKLDKHPSIVLRSPFWANAAKAECTAQAAKDVGAVYVDAGPLGLHDENKAVGLFWHRGVENHPGDLGMRRIAELILAGFGSVESRDGSMSASVRQTPGGPRLFVDGKPVRPRFFYGSPTCLCNISGEKKTVLKIPFAADRDTLHGRVALNGYPGVDPLWFSDAKLVDLTSGTTNVVLSADEERNTLNYAADSLSFVKGHRYHFVVTHRATRSRTYFTIEISYSEGGRKVTLPYYYGDTLGDTVALAATAGVDLVTFSTDSSWGCEGWWNPPEAPEDYSKIDREFERLVKINPKALLVPRIMTDAPAWMHERHPEIRMAYEPHCSLVMSSVSSRLYRKSACEAVEKLSRHLKSRFPRNYAGLQISGQNSAEWFYMLSQSEYLSGYDVATMAAFREWLKARGDDGWATAEVPTPGERRCRSPSHRTVEFARFRQREMASFLVELGVAAKRGAHGDALALFFYGYSWELGGTLAAEAGHFDFGWLLRNAHGKIDGFSSPLSYSSRNLTGSTVMMSAAESVMRNGYLWFNEIDHRTHHEEMWDHMSLFKPYSDPAITREIFLRDSAADILRGYGDWWMDLFGRGWHRDADIWRLRGELNALDDAVAKRRRPYSPQIAAVVHEDSFLCGGQDRSRHDLLNRKGFATCGADYGQYLLEDVLANPPKSARLFYLVVAGNLQPDVRAKLNALKAARPDATFIENVTPEDITAESIAARAEKAGVHRFTAPGAANVCSSEGFVLVQALRDGPLAIDFGSSRAVYDALNGGFVCSGSKATLSFRLGETRLFRIATAAPASARWISGDSAEPHKPAPVLYREFGIDSVPANAVFSVAVAGWCEVHVNGEKIGKDVLSPVTCQPDMRTSSLNFDVTPLLKPGTNTLEVLLGNGWQNTFTKDAWGFCEAPWMGAPKIRGELVCDGKPQFSTDGYWRAYDSPIVFNALRNGEWYDARREGERINERPATVEKYAPWGVVSAEDAVPCREGEAFEPKSVGKTPYGHVLYDFCANIAGWCEIEVEGERGAKVTLDYDESLDTRGWLLEGIKSLTRGRGETRPVMHDEYTLAGRAGGERWHPRFTYHGFRYVAAMLHGNVRIKSIRARFVHSGFERAGTLSTSDKTFAALQSATERSYLSNFVGIPTDCPHREKNGWTADAQLAMETGLWNFDARASYVHFLRMMLDSQRPNGAVSCILPCSPKFGFGWGSGPAWDAVLFEIPWQIFRFYGDDAPAREAYQAMKRYIAFISDKADADGLVEYGLGDWCNYQRKPSASVRLTDSAYVYEFNRRVAFWAKRFGEADYSAERSVAAGKIKAAFNRAFYKGGGIYENGHLTALAAPLYFKGLCADGEEEKVAKRLVEAVRERGHKAHFGILGAKWVPRVLADYGYADDAFKMYVQPEMPGWAHWLQFGDGTLREEWDDYNSHNHIMFGDLSAWAYEYAVGIVPLEPGFRKVAFRPHFIDGVDSFSATYRTPHGEIRAGWKRVEGKPVFEYSVPEGVEVD